MLLGCKLALAQIKHYLSQKASSDDAECESVSSISETKTSFPDMLGISPLIR